MIETTPPLELDPELLVLFGPPGSGKTYLGQRLRDTHGYFSYDADMDFPPDIKELLKTGILPTVEQREEFHRLMADRVAEFLNIYPKVLLSYLFTADRTRAEFRTRFPFAQFVLVEASRSQQIANIYERYARTNFHAPPSVSIRAGELFEPVSVPFVRLQNIRSDLA